MTDLLFLTDKTYEKMKLVDEEWECISDGFDFKNYNLSIEELENEIFDLGPSSLDITIKGLITLIGEPIEDVDSGELNSYSLHINCNTNKEKQIIIALLKSINDRI